MVLASALLILISMVTFSVFGYGFQGFKMASGRQGLQGDARAVMSRLRQDVEQSTFLGISMDDGPTRQVMVDGMVQPRHLLCMPGLTDWNDPNNFDSQTGLPKWDSYILYQPELQPDTARLFRVEWIVGGNLAGQSWPDFTSYRTLYLNAPAPKGTNINGGTAREMRALAGKVLGFETTKSTKSVLVTLRLKNRAKGPVGGSSRDEILEIRSRCVPKNLAF